MKLPPPKERVISVIDQVFGGVHHLGRLYHEGEGTPDEYWEASRVGEVSTFDDDLLTRLVIAGHRHCIRVSITPSGPFMLKFRFHPRSSQNGTVWERHPDLSDLAKRVTGAS